MIERIKKIYNLRIYDYSKEKIKQRISYTVQAIASIVILNLLLKFYVINKSGQIDINHLIIMILIFLLGVMCNFVMSVYKKYYRCIQENEHLKNYIKMMEEINIELRRFKHNYLNILSTLYAYIDEQTNEELRNYFLKIVEQCREMKKINIAGLSALNIIPLRGIISVKINKAIENKINVEMYSDSNLELDNIEICDLCEAVGVFLDNAIEECKKLGEDSRKIIINISNLDRYVAIQIKNTYLQKPNIQKIFEKGFSTKGRGRGIGLYCVKKTLCKYPKVYLDTFFENEKRMIIQEIDVEHKK